MKDKNKSALDIVRQLETRISELDSFIKRRFGDKKTYTIFEKIVQDTRLLNVRILADIKIRYRIK